MSNRFKCNVKEVDDKIDSLLDHFPVDHSDLIRDMFTAVAKFGLESNDRGDAKLLNITIKELRYAFTIFSRYRHVPKVAIFGSARTDEEENTYKLAKRFAEEITGKGYMVITGAGGGIMEAGNLGAGPDKSFGVNIRLPFEQKANSYILDERLIHFKYFFTRKLIFQKESDASVLLPGGFGTLDEGMEVLTLIQTGKGKPRPIIMMEPEGESYWGRFLDFVKEGLLKGSYVSPGDEGIFKIVHHPAEAVQEIESFYKVYHSIRYVGKKTYLRFKKELSVEMVEELNREFSDILSDGRIEISPPSESEIKNGEYPELFRLKMNFDHRHMARLLTLIRFVNEKASFSETTGD